MGARDDWGDEGTRLFGTGYQRYSLLKGYSALGSISRVSSLSTLHKLIAQLLLLNGAYQIPSEEVNDQRKEMIEKKRNGDAARDQDALHLLSLELPDAADWIDNNLPLPPNPQALTAGGPLPSPPHLALNTFTKASLTLSEEVSNSIPSPCFESISNLSKPQTDFKPLNTSATDDNLLKQVKQSLDNTEVDEKRFGSGSISSAEPPIQRTSRLPQSSIPRSSSHESTLRTHSPLQSDSRLPRSPGPHSQSKPTLTTLLLAGLPCYCSKFHLEQIFVDIQVEVKEMQLELNRAYVQVDSSRAQHCVDSLHLRKIVGDSVISYYALKVKTGPSQTTSCFPPKPSNLPFPNERIDPPQRHSLAHLLPSHAPNSSASSITLSSHTILHIAGLPPHFDSVSKVTQLFQDRGIKISGCRLGNYDPLERLPFAFVSVEECYTSRCFKLINGKSIDGFQIELLSFRKLVQKIL